MEERKRNILSFKIICGYNGRISLLEQNVKTGHGRVLCSNSPCIMEKLRDFSLMYSICSFDFLFCVCSVCAMRMVRRKRIKWNIRKMIFTAQQKNQCHWSDDAVFCILVLFCGFKQKIDNFLDNDAFWKFFKIDQNFCTVKVRSAYLEVHDNINDLIQYMTSYL